MSHYDRDEPEYISFDRLESLSSALVSTEGLCALSRSDPLHLRSVVLLLSGAFTLAMSIALRHTDGSGMYDKESEKALRAYHDYEGHNDGNPASGSPEYPNKLRLAPPKELWSRAQERFGFEDPEERVKWFFDNMRNELEHPKADVHSITYSDFLASTLAVATAIQQCLKIDDIAHRHEPFDAHYALAIQSASAIVSFLRDNPPNARFSRWDPDDTD